MTAASTSTNEHEDNYISSSPSYAKNPIWADIQPIFNTIEEDACVNIRHSDEFIDAFAYLRAILHKNEISERAFDLTTHCSQLNPANYSVWLYRRKLLKELKKDLAAEFKFCEETVYESPKNYQIWYHRRFLVEQIGSAERELEFTKEVLQIDSKNYHAWQHRQWVIQHYKRFNEEEINFTTYLLDEDVRNNSAWNYRHFIIEKMSDNFGDERFVLKEIDFIKEQLKKVVINESAWQYLKKVIHKKELADYPDLLDFVQSLLAKTPCSYLRIFLFDHHEKLVLQNIDRQVNGEKALHYLNELEDVDNIRSAFYDYLKSRIKTLIAASES